MATEGLHVARQCRQVEVAGVLGPGDVPLADPEDLGNLDLAETALLMEAVQGHHRVAWLEEVGAAY
jgi:hypothetical protein